MKSIKYLVLVLFVVTLLTGCSKSSSNMELDYAVFDGHKIEMKSNFKEYVLQFKGMNCLFSSGTSNYDGIMEIDGINSDNHPFYSLSGGVEFDVECPVNGEYFVTFSARTTPIHKEGYESFFSRDLDVFNVRSTQDSVEVYTKDNKKFIVGKTNEADTKESIISIFGEPTYENTASDGITLTYDINDSDKYFMFTPDNHLWSVQFDK